MDTVITPWFESCWRYHSDRFAQSGIKIIQEPVDEPITVDEAAVHLRIDGYGSPLEYPERAWIVASITAARETVEGLSGLALAPQVLEMGMSALPWGWYAAAPVSLRTSPVRGIESVIYTDGDGVDQTLDPLTYTVDDYSRPARVYPALNASWPSAAELPNSVRIRFAAGYTTPGSSPDDAPLPKSLRHAILLMLGHIYENRESTSAIKLEEIPMGVNALIERYRIRTSMA